MPWLKKNLTWVIAGVVALGLLGVSGYFLYSKWKHSQEVSQQLAAQRMEYDRLNNLRPHPGRGKINNIATARKQAERLEALLEEFQSGFEPFDVPTNVTSGMFKEKLLRTIHDLTVQAERNGVKLGTNFAFSFSSLQKQLLIEPAQIPDLTRQLVHVTEISRLLLNSRVLTIDEIKRPTLEPEEESEDGSTTTSTMTFGGGSSNTPDEMGATADYWDRRTVTNELAVVSPYAFTFHAFTKELADFLSALSSSPHCFMVKNIAVDTTSSPLLAKPMQMPNPYSPYGMGMGAAGGMSAGMASRYGLGAAEMGRYGLGGLPGMGRGPVRRGNKTILIEEHPFRVRAWIYVVELLPPGMEGMAPAPAMGDPYGTGADRYSDNNFDPSAVLR